MKLNLPRKVLILVFLTLTGPTSAQPKANPDVYLFSQPACPGCVAAKTYFKKQGIIFHEFDITQSSKARETFEKLGGQGTPFILVAGKRLQAFSPERFDSLMEKALATPQ